MTRYFYCAFHKSGEVTEYQNGFCVCDVQADHPAFLDRLKAKIAHNFNVPCSSGQTIILTLTPLP